MANGPEFFQTGMGRRFYEGTMPALVAATLAIVNVSQEIRDVSQELRAIRACEVLKMEPKAEDCPLGLAPCVSKARELCWKDL